MNSAFIIILFLVIMFFQDLIIANFDKTTVNFISYIDEFFIIYSLGLIIFKNSMSMRIRKSTLTLILLLMGILLFGFLSNLFNQVALSTSLKGAFLTLKGFLLFFIFKHIKFHEKAIDKIVNVIKYLGFTAVFFAFIDLLFHESFRNFLNTNNMLDTRSGLISVQSIFIHPGTYGWFMLFVGLFYLSQYLIKGEKKSLFYTIFFFFCAVLSFRFKVLLTIVTILMLVTLKKRVYIVGLTFAGVIVYMAFGNVIQDLTMLTINRYISVDYMESARKALYHTGFLIGFKEFPIAEGFGRFGSWIARVEYSPVYYEYGLNNVYGLSPDNPIWATDTYWPSIIGEVGIIGAILFILFFVYVIRFIFVNLQKSDHDQKHKIFLLFSLFVIVQSLIESTGEQIFNNSPQYIFIFIIIGMAFSVIENRDSAIKLKSYSDFM